MVLVPQKAVVEVSKLANPYERLVVVSLGWQRESTELAAGWSCVFLKWLYTMVAEVTWLVTSPQLLDVVWCSDAAVVVVA